MTVKEQIIYKLNELKTNIISMTNLAQDKKQAIVTKIEKTLAEAPEGCCGSPDVVLGVHIMQDTYKDIVVELMNSF
jgi:hypothetical protein